MKEFLCFGNIGTALFRVIGGEGAEDDFRIGVCHFFDKFRKLNHGEFPRIADIDRSGDLIWRVHHADHGVDQVLAVAEAAGLRSIAVDGDVFALEGLDDEVADDPSVIRMHVRPVGVENTDDFYPETALSVIGGEKGFCGPFPLIIAGSLSDGIHIAPVFLDLRMNVGISVDFRC